MRGSIVIGLPVALFVGCGSAHTTGDEAHSGRAAGAALDAGSEAGGAGNGGSGTSEDVTPTEVSASFVADVPAGQTEAYVCYSFDAPGLGGVLVGSIDWTPPTGSVTLHHASLYAARDAVPIGPIPCDPMPERVAAFGLYTPGAIPVELPQGDAISVPDGTTRLLVLAHVLRFDDGPAGATTVRLGIVPSAEHPLNWVDIPAPVPTLFPHQTQSSVAKCTFPRAVHLVTDWPHMHQLGASFTSLIVRSDGHAETILDVSPWDYTHQPIYPISFDLAAGEAIETICTWNNTTDQNVEGGPFLADEMCTQGLFVWPFDAATCSEE